MRSTHLMLNAVASFRTGTVIFLFDIRFVESILNGQTRTTTANLLASNGWTLLTCVPRCWNAIPEWPSILMDIYVLPAARQALATNTTFVVQMGRIRPFTRFIMMSQMLRKKSLQTAAVWFFQSCRNFLKSLALAKAACGMLCAPGEWFPFEVAAHSVFGNGQSRWYIDDHSSSLASFLAADHNGIR